MAHEAGKGDKRRPGQGYQSNYDLIDWGVKLKENGDFEIVPTKDESETQGESQQERA